jgi:hypothetical protein
MEQEKDFFELLFPLKQTETKQLQTYRAHYTPIMPPAYIFLSGLSNGHSSGVGFLSGVLYFFEVLIFIGICEFALYDGRRPV